MNRKYTEIYDQNKQSGWLKVFLGFAFLIIAVPMIIIGICQASANGVKWIGQHSTRKLARLERKKDKQEIKQRLEELKKEKNDRKK